MRNPLSTCRGVRLRISQYMATISVSARMNPIIGDSTINNSVLLQPCGMMTCSVKALAMAAPAYPPIKACEDEVGSPHHHVSRSQMIAPKSPVSTTYWFTKAKSIMPLPMVLATAVPSTKAATKLKNAAQITASLGESTRVETTVAMLFAAS